MHCCYCRTSNSNSIIINTVLRLLPTEPLHSSGFFVTHNLLPKPIVLVVKVSPFALLFCKLKIDIPDYFSKRFTLYFLIFLPKKTHQYVLRHIKPNHKFLYWETFRYKTISGKSFPIFYKTFVTDGLQFHHTTDPQDVCCVLPKHYSLTINTFCL